MAFVLLAYSTKLNALKTKINKGKRGKARTEQRRKSCELMQGRSLASVQNTAVEKGWRRPDHLWSTDADLLIDQVRNTGEQSMSECLARLFQFNSTFSLL